MGTEPRMSKPKHRWFRRWWRAWRELCFDCGEAHRDLNPCPACKELVCADCIERHD